MGSELRIGAAEVEDGVTDFGGLGVEGGEREGGEGGGEEMCGDGGRGGGHGLSEGCFFMFAFFGIFEKVVGLD